MTASVDIKDQLGTPRFSTPINEGSKRKFLLMKEDYVTLKFSLDNPIYFQLGDYIDNELGLFELVDLYKPSYNASTGGYDYELRLDAYYWKWKNKVFKYLPESAGGEASWSLTATLDTQLKVFERNLAALGYTYRGQAFTARIAPSVADKSLPMTYDNTNLLDALTQMAEAWECEWWIEENYIRFGRCEYGDPMDFELGVNVQEMARSDSRMSYATRVYAFGSTRNIPDTYRKSLVFDVKRVNGRDISDTARSLDIKFFPARVVHKEEFGISLSLGSGLLHNGNRSWDHDEPLSSTLAGGTYRVTDRGLGMTFTVGTFYNPVPMDPVVPRPNLPAGDYLLKAAFAYRSGGAEKEIPIGSRTVTLGENRQAEFSESFELPLEVTIDKGASDLVVRTSLLIPSYTQTGTAVTPNVKYDLSLMKGSSAQTSVTFLSGTNEGRTFSAVYNPDLIIGEGSNVLRLPEGVTASVGDRYTVDNLIKGKVPSNYFSKDDHEVTLNGVVQKRLMLPPGVACVDAYRYSPSGERIDMGNVHYNDPENVEMPQEEAVEAVVVFEDEYPKYTGSTVEVPEPRLEDELDEENNPTDNKYPVYSFKDTDLKNFTKDFLLKGTELRLVFQTGKLAGLDFGLDLKGSDETGTTFEIIPNDDYGRRLPDDTLFPQAAHTENGKEVPADTYVLHGFDTAYISEQMLPDSENTLLKKAREYVKKSMMDPSTYDCKMMSPWAYGTHPVSGSPDAAYAKSLTAGDRVKLVNKAYFTEGRQSRVIGFEYNLDMPYDSPVYTIGETAAYSRLGELEEKIDSLTYKGQTYSGTGSSGGGPGVYVIGVNDRTQASDRNVFSAKRTLNEIRQRALSRLEDDEAAGKITFRKGLVSSGLVEANAGATFGKFSPGFLGTGGCFRVDPVTGKSYIEADEMYIRLKAVFDSLEIRHTTHVGGQEILSPAGMSCVRVEEFPDFYRCYMHTDDGGKAVRNLFVPGDQAHCREMNVKEGVYANVSNQYYWRLVVGTGEDYVDLDKIDCAPGSTAPKAGDSICQLGHRSEKERQNAIVISAYGAGSPSLKIYTGIDSYSLDGREDTRLKPGDNELSAKLSIKPGTTGWENIEGLPDEIRKAVDAVDKIEFGKNNLLRNSGFAGDYQTLDLGPDSELGGSSELYSPSLKYWDPVNAHAQDSTVSVSGKEVEILNGSIVQSLYYKMLAGENYIFSFRGKGTSFTFSCGGYTETVLLTNEYEHYVCKFKTLSIGGIFSIHSTTGTFCELQLERGTVVSAWGPSMTDNTSELAHYQSLQYLASSIKDASVDILGGLVLANVLQLGNYKDGKMQKVTAGISGIYNNEDDVFAFGGGTFEQAIATVAKYKDNPAYQPTEDELQNMAKFVATHGGRTILNDVVVRGYIYALGGIFQGRVDIAQGRILLNEDGGGRLAGGAISWDRFGNIYRKSHEVILWREISREIEEAGAPDVYDIQIEGGTYWEARGGYETSFVINLPDPSLHPNITIEVLNPQPRTRVPLYFCAIQCAASPLLVWMPEEYEYREGTAKEPDPHKGNGLIRSEWDGDRWRWYALNFLIAQ